ncbi:hypothetical protein K438DRAFT_1763059 [Mycena galopus ATCC 62051]|nr:hypothetical protein K438DRAFT_1763059 [Mycena galopus ATCC 62051]
MLVKCEEEDENVKVGRVRRGREDAPSMLPPWPSTSLTGASSLDGGRGSSGESSGFSVIARASGVDGGDENGAGSNRQIPNISALEAKSVFGRAVLPPAAPISTVIKSFFKFHNPTHRRRRSTPSGHTRTRLSRHSVLTAINMCQLTAPVFCSNETKAPLFFLTTQLFIAVLLFLRVDALRLPPDRLTLDIKVCRGLVPIVGLSVLSLRYGAVYEHIPMNDLERGQENQQPEWVHMDWR